jgi:CAAX protease family protein
MIAQPISTPIRAGTFWAEIGIVAGPAIVILVSGNYLIEENPFTLQIVSWFANMYMIGAVLILQRRAGGSLAEFGLIAVKFATPDILRLVGASLISFVLAAAAFVLGSIIMANITGIPEQADMSSYNFLSGNLPILIVSLTAVFIGSSFGEELIYRGFLITRLTRLLGNNKRATIIAVVISSMIFGLIHYTWGPMGIVQTAFMGAALATAWLKFRKNLWVVILAHAYMDFALLVQMYLS